MQVQYNRGWLPAGPQTGSDRRAAGSRRPLWPPVSCPAHPCVTPQWAGGTWCCHGDPRPSHNALGTGRCWALWELWDGWWKFKQVTIQTHLNAMVTNQLRSLNGVYFTKNRTAPSRRQKESYDFFVNLLDIVRCLVKFRYYLKFHGASTAFCIVNEGKMTSAGHRTIVVENLNQTISLAAGRA